MSNQTEFDNYELSEKACAEIDKWLAKFPNDQKQSAVIAALHALQDDIGWCPRGAMKAVARYLDMPEIAVYEVATFYTMFNLKPVGKYKIHVCTNISCQLCDSDKIVDKLKSKLGIGFGETTSDGKFTLREEECLAACRNAPMMMIGKDFHENLTPEKVDKILDGLE